MHKRSDNIDKTVSSLISKDIKNFDLKANDKSLAAFIKEIGNRLGNFSAAVGDDDESIFYRGFGNEPFKSLESFDMGREGLLYEAIPEGTRTEMDHLDVVLPGKDVALLVGGKTLVSISPQFSGGNRRMKCQDDERIFVSSAQFVLSMAAKDVPALESLLQRESFFGPASSGERGDFAGAHAFSHGFKKALSHDKLSRG